MAIDADARFSRRFEVVGQSSAFTRKKSYEVVLDLGAGLVLLQRATTAVAALPDLTDAATSAAAASTAAEDDEVDRSAALRGSLSRGRTKRLLQQRVSTFRSRSNRPRTLHSHRCEEIVKMTRLDQFSALRVVIGHQNSKDSKSKILWFAGEQDRELFVKLIHSYITCGTEARESFDTIPHSESQGLNFCDYLLSYSMNVESSQQQHSKNETDESTQDKEARCGSPSFTVSTPQKDKTSTCVDMHQAKDAVLRGQLLLGEVISLRQEHTLWMQRQLRTRGVLIVSNYRLLFLSYRSSCSSALAMLEVPLATISRIEKSGQSALELLILHCKDLRTLSFGFDASDSWFHGFVETLQKFAFPEVQTNAFAFSHNLPAASAALDGWNFFNALEHYKQLGLDRGRFRITRANENYGLCRTYPKYLVVPQIMTDTQLRQASCFRSGERLPVITWKHPETHAVLARCSQPLTGLKGKRNEMDEFLIAAIREANPTNSQLLYILDARPFKSAVGNTVMGKGYENTAYYCNCELQFLGIDNIHVIRGCLERMVEVINMDSPNYDESTFLSRVESTQWLHYIRLLLSAAVSICDMMADRGVSVVTHCSDGWDRTSQLCALAQLLMDPSCRTIQGFAVLIEKEWLSFGHKFAERCGHCSANFSDDQRAPIFLQFLDCVWQILMQFPLAFEFNESFLLVVATNLYSCRFGTFLFDNARERDQTDVVKRTTSLWTYICSDGVCQRYINPMYEFAKPSGRLVPVVNAQSVVLWQNMYQRWRHLPEGQNSVHSTCAMVAQKYRKALQLLDEHNIEFGFIEAEVEKEMAQYLAPDLDLKAVSLPSPPKKPSSPSSLHRGTESSAASSRDRSISPLRLTESISSDMSDIPKYVRDVQVPASYASAASFVPSWLWPSSITSASAAAVTENPPSEQTASVD